MTLVQKRFFGLLALCVVTAAVGGLVMQQEKRSNDAQDRKQAAQKLFDIPGKEAIRELTLVTPEGTFVIGHEGTGDKAWRLMSPMQTIAEATTVDALAQAALDLKMTSRVGGQGDKDEFNQPITPPADLSLFGLQPPRYSLTVKTADGQTQTMQVGKKNGYDGSLYVKRADRADVGLCSGSFAYQLDQDLYKLRDKRPLLVSSDDIQRLRVITAQGAGFTVERKDHTFALTAPFAAGADESQVNQVLGAISGLRAKSFVSESAPTTKERKPFGLDAPTYTVDVGLKDSTVARLLFGQIKLGNNESHYFVMQDGNHPVLELGSDWAFKKLGIEPKELRDTHVLAFDREAVRGITITRGTTVLALQKSRDDKEGLDSWSITTPAKATAQGAKVAGLLYKLWNLKADNVAVEKPSAAELNAHGLEQPETRIDLAGANGESLGSILLGNTDGDKRFVTNHLHDRIDRVQTSTVEDISVQAADYQEDATAKSN